MLRFKEVKVNRTLHELEDGTAYYNYEGNSYKLFKTFEDGIRFLETKDKDLIITEVRTEDELGVYLRTK